MSQVTVRLANEGVPVQAIARAVGIPSNDVRAQLADALLMGDLVILPLNDWPVNSHPGDRRPTQTSVEIKPAHEQAALRLFKLSPMLTQILFLLLQQPEVSRERLSKLFNGKSESLLNVTMLHLRRRLQVHGITIHNMYGFGYCMSLAHQRKVRALLRGK